MHFIPEIQIYTLLGLKKFQVLCYCNTSCVLQSAKQFFYLVTSSVEISDWFDLVELPKDPGYYSLEAKVIALVISTVNIWSEYNSTHMCDRYFQCRPPCFSFWDGFSRHVLQVTYVAVGGRRCLSLCPMHKKIKRDVEYCSLLVAWWISSILNVQIHWYDDLSCRWLGLVVSLQ